MSDQPEEMTHAEWVAFASEYMRNLAAFAAGTSRVCPDCGEPVLGATCYEKTEPTVFSLYVQPCNHWLGLWSKVPAWIADVEVVPLHEDDGDDAE